MNAKEVIVAWLANYLAESGAKGYVIGLSGGVDSTVAAALAIGAVGPEKVLGVYMPCHSNAKDRVLANQVAGWLKIELLEINLDRIYDVFESSMSFLPMGNGLGPFNVKPRLRMIVLYRIANARNHLVLGTGDKSECAVGYFTKYGDGGVDLLPLGDPYKTEIQALAREMGAPPGATERPPSAGLWPGQTDEGEMGITYAELDQMLAGTKQKDEMVLNMITAASHKLAMPPICLLGEQE